MVLQRGRQRRGGGSGGGGGRGGGGGGGGGGEGGCEPLEYLGKGSVTLISLVGRRARRQVHVDEAEALTVQRKPQRHGALVARTQQARAYDLAAHAAHVRQQLLTNQHAE